MDSASPRQPHGAHQSPADGGSAPPVRLLTEWERELNEEGRHSAAGAGIAVLAAVVGLPLIAGLIYGLFAVIFRVPGW